MSGRAHRLCTMNENWIAVDGGGRQIDKLSVASWTERPQICRIRRLIFTQHDSGIYSFDLVFTNSRAHLAACTSTRMLSIQDPMRRAPYLNEANNMCLADAPISHHESEYIPKRFRIDSLRLYVDVASPLPVLVPYLLTRFGSLPSLHWTWIYRKWTAKKILCTKNNTNSKIVDTFFFLFSDGEAHHRAHKSHNIYGYGFEQRVRCRDA